jgi:SulP family sulfate permease
MTQSVQTSDLRADVLAGATVALVGLPQCLAYATVSGLPPAYGLATAIVPGLVAAITSQSRYIVTGPTNTTGLLILGALVPFLGPNGLLEPESLGRLATLTLLCGAVRIVMALTGGAALFRFIPESVLAGFTIGVGILIGVMQLDEAVGLPPVRGAGLTQEYLGLTALIAAGSRPSLAAVGVTLATIAALALGSRVSRRLPMPLIVVAAAAAIAWWLGIDAAAGVPLVGNRAEVPAGWPSGALPDLRPSVIAGLFVPAVAIAVLGTLELLVSVRADESRPNVPREIVSQGVANMAGAFAAGFPASASLTRSALLRFANPQTRVAAASAALFTLPILLLGSRVIAYIPEPTLAGVLLITAARMVKQPTLGRVWKASRMSRLLLGITAASALMLPLAWAVFVGAGLGLIIHLARTSAPRVRALTFKGDRLVPVDEGQNPAVVVLEVSGAVHYAAVEPLLENVERHLPPAVRLVILDLSHAHELRFTGVRAFEWWARDLKRRGIRLRLAGVAPEVRDLLESTDSNLTYTMWDPEPGRSAWNSYRQDRP